MRILIAPRSLDCNRGDQALMDRAIEVIRSADRSLEIAVMAGDPEDIQVRQTRNFGVKVLPEILPHPRRAAVEGRQEVVDSGISLWRMRFRAVIDLSGSLLLLISPRSRRWAQLLLGKERFRTYDYLLSCRALVVRGGGFIYAHAGLFWAYFLWFSLFPLFLARRCGVPVLIFPNSFGPFDTRWSRWWARQVLGRCRLVTAREPLSRDLLNRIIPGRALLFPDMAFGLKPAPASWAESELSRVGVPLQKRLCLGVTMRPWRFPGSDDPRGRYELYLRSFAGFLRYAVGRGYAPVLFAHSVGPHVHEDDRIALRAAMKLSTVGEQLILIDEEYDCRQAQALYGKMDSMICTRLHAAIFSISQGVPCVTVSYQGYKAQGIMGEIGLGEFVLPIENINADSLISAFERLQSEEERVKQKMKKYMTCCREELSRFSRLVAAELEEELSPRFARATYQS